MPMPVRALSGLWRERAGNSSLHGRAVRTARARGGRRECVSVWYASYETSYSHFSLPQPLPAATVAQGVLSKECAMFTFWPRLGSRFSSCAAKRTAPRQRQIRLQVEELHDRVLPAVSPVFTNSLGQLIINGTRFADSVHISTNGDQVVVDLNGTTYQFDAAKVQKVIFNGGNGNDFCENLTNISSILRGGNGADWLVGGSAADKIFGQNGPDKLQGVGDNDTCVGGMGADWIEGGLGDDDLEGNLGPDKIFGGLGDDTCLGGAGVDQVSGGYGKDVASGELLDTEIGLLALLTS